MSDKYSKKLKDEKPAAYGFWKTVLIVLSGHIGVRTTVQKRADFERANGVYVFFIAVIYFLLLIAGLIVLVNYISG
ncbi:hypothetical protein A9Q89_04980 [Gammaproteobacteria bacterium 53_120_T64]|nr:hypothetical protein A9Q89_04980 [Gammaproteobacteria bacterium 53_120_T64]